MSNYAVKLILTTSYPYKSHRIGNSSSRHLMYEKMSLINRQIITAGSLQEALEKAVVKYQSISDKRCHIVSIQGPDQRFPASYSLAELCAASEKSPYTN
jgi:hypothetical protein